MSTANRDVRELKGRSIIALVGYPVGVLLECLGSLCQGWSVLMLS